MSRAAPASGSRTSVFVAVLTAAALAVVAFFAYQASAANDRPTAGGPPAESPSPDADGEEGPPPLPAESGQGRRVVYALGQQRVWLVDLAADGTGEVISDTFRVHPSSVSPPPGTYAVTSRYAQGIGSDGVAIEHSVVFHQTADNVVFGFSAALDGSTPDPRATARTGGIRQSRENGDATWLFATENTPVVVVP